MRTGKRIAMTLLLCSCLPQGASAVTHDVRISGPRFSPKNFTIEVGDTVRWTNSGGVHDLTADEGIWNAVTGRVNVLEQYANEPPTAQLSSNCVELTCNFTDQSTDPDGSIASRSWHFGDGDSSTSVNPTHTYASAGTYSVLLIVTDDGGASDTRTRTVPVSGPATTFLINAATTDAWFSPLADGQGFFIIVWEESGLIFLSWFTFDTERPPGDVTAILGEPGHRWLTAQGPYSGDTATLDVYLSSGGVFDAADPVPETGAPIGTMTIVWTGCNSGTLNYGLPSLGLSGAIEIERIVLDKVPACEAAQP